MITDVSTESSPVSEQAVALYGIPAEPSFYALPDDVRRDVRRWLKTLKAVDGLVHPPEGAQKTSVNQACRTLAARMQGARGFSKDRIRTKWYAFKKSGDWKDLADWARVGDPNEKLPAEFVQFWKKLCEENQRKDAPAYRELLQIWRTGFDSNDKEYKEIPGYGPIGGPYASVPKGWSYGNLNRYNPSRQEKAVARIGPVAASVFRKKVLVTRVGLRLGQYVEFDDQVYDQKVNFLGKQQSRAMRPLGFNALDVLSAFPASYSFKPTIWNDDLKVKEQLKEADMMWFVINYLFTHGFRTDEVGTVLIVEHGTAAISAAFEQRIFDATGGKVRVERSGITGDPAYAGMFEGARKGNFRFKGAIESFFNLVRNETAALPGQVGKDRDHSPEQMVGLERYNNLLLKAVNELTPELASRLKFPVLELNEWIGRVISLYDRMARRTEHKLEGWRELGFVTTDWRVDPTQEQWFHMEQFLNLPEGPARDALAALLENDHGKHTRARQLSPYEVWHKHKNELTPLEIFKLPDLLGMDAGIPRKVEEGLIQFEDQDIDCKPLRFDAVIDGQALRDGETFLTHLNPFNPSALVLCNARGGYVGTIPRTVIPSRSDYEGIKRDMGAAKKHEADMFRTIGLRHTDKAVEKTAMHQNNADVMQQSVDGLTPGQRKKQSGTRRAKPSELNEIFGPDSDCSPRREEGDSQQVPARQECPPNVAAPLGADLTLNDLADL